MSNPSTPVPPPRLTAAQVGEIEQRVAAATPGPWVAYPFGVHDRKVSGYKPIKQFGYAFDADELRVMTHVNDWQMNATDAQFIAHARTDLPLLLQDRAALVAEVERLKAVIYGMVEACDVPDPEDEANFAEQVRHAWIGVHNAAIYAGCGEWDKAHEMLAIRHGSSLTTPIPAPRGRDEAR